MNDAIAVWEDRVTSRGFDLIEKIKRQGYYTTQVFKKGRYTVIVYNGGPWVFVKTGTVSLNLAVKETDHRPSLSFINHPTLTYSGESDSKGIVPKRLTPKGDPINVKVEDFLTVLGALSEPDMLPTVLHIKWALPLVEDYLKNHI